MVDAHHHSSGVGAVADSVESFGDSELRIDAFTRHLRYIKPNFSAFVPSFTVSPSGYLNSLWQSRLRAMIGLAKSRFRDRRWNRKLVGCARLFLASPPMYSSSLC